MINSGTIIRQIVTDQRMIEDLVQRIENKTTTQEDSLLILKHINEIEALITKKSRWADLDKATTNSLRYKKC